MAAEVPYQCWHCLGGIRWRETWAKSERGWNAKTAADTAAPVCDWKTYRWFPWASLQMV